MRSIRFFILLFISPLFCSAQIENLIFAPPDSTFADANPSYHYNRNFLSPQDSIFLSFDYFDQKYIQHRIGSGHTLYSLSRFYGLTTEELYFFNPGLREGEIALGQVITIPIPNRAILRYPPTPFDSTQYVRIYYIVRRGDTMFDICKRQFRMPVETVVMRNNLGETGIRPGQHLHIGWMSIYGIPKEYHSANLDPITRRNAAMREVFLQSVDLENIKEDKGAAVWKKDSQEDSDFYALHRTAPVNSVIEVLNPMNRRIIYAKVIGKIPDRAYDPEVIVVLSPLSAKALGARDPRFFVQVRY